jgi:type VI secretion system Hcp family effector
MVMRAAKLAAVAVFLCLVVIGLSAQASWAEDAFARITGSVQGSILGDQPNIQAIPGSLNAVQVFGTGFSLENPVGTTPGQVTGRPTAGPLSLVKRFDRASPKLLRAAFTSEPLTVEIIWFMTLGGVIRQTVSVKLEGAVITHIEAVANLNGGSAAGNESVSFTYSRITFTVPTINAQGQTTGTTSVCLDLVVGKAC